MFIADTLTFQEFMAREKLPQLKKDSGAVLERLQAAGVDQAVFEVWKELVAKEIVAPDEDDEF